MNARRAKFADGYLYIVGDMTQDELEAAALLDDPIWKRGLAVDINDVPEEAFNARMTTRGVRIWYEPDERPYG